MATAEESSALRLLSQARQRFLTGRPLPDDVPDETVAAWRRARFLGVRHDERESAPVGCPAVRSALLVAAGPVLERLAPTLGTCRSALLLTDERLRVLWSAGGGPSGGLRRDLAEREVGHNSAALALRTRRRAEVHGPEHFLDVWQDVSAVSVPVFAPESGRPLGTITVASGLCADAGPHPGTALAEAAAAAVEAELLARSRSAERTLLDAYTRATRGAGDGREPAVVALDGRNRLVSEAAVRLLSPQVLESLERGARTLSRSATPVESYDIALPEGAGCTAEFRPVREPGGGRVLGIVAVLEPVPQPEGAAAVRGLPRPVTGRLAGSSVPWLHAVGRAAELARGAEPLLLTGERGSGKTALARELLGGTDPLVLDAAEAPELGLGERKSLGDRPLLLRHAELLGQSDVAALNGLLDERPDVRLLATYTPGAPPGRCLQRLLDTLAAGSVTLPALRERPEDIRELLPALAPRPVDGRPPLTWTLDALRALERYPWPGNLTELAHLVRTLTETRRAVGPVRRAELPDPVREGPAERPLSPMEHAERTAILEALRRNGGNKTRTATALGIARATLYRKLREYRA